MRLKIPLFLLCAGSLTVACEGRVLDKEASSSAEHSALPSLPRLTISQWRNQIADTFSPEAPQPQLPADTNPYLFNSIGASSSVLSERDAQLYATAATAIADWIFADPTRRNALLGCDLDAEGATCMDAVLSRVGASLYRRPLRSEELELWREIANDTARDGNLSRGLRIALIGLMQSPSFLYRVELGEPHPDLPGRNRYTSHEMAQRLAFLLWDRGPDAELVEAAANGDLLTREGLREQAERMLDDTRARSSVQSFFAQYFGLEELRSLDRDPELYPAFTPTIGAAMRTEIELNVDDLVFRRNGDIRELFSSRRTFVNRELADFYNVDAPSATEVAFSPVELPADGLRAGVLTSGGLLAMNAHRTETSPTLRGKFVLERVLCVNVPSPPDDADLEIDGETEEAHTLRERLSQHVKDPSCAGCHKLIDPPGFLFEGFDSLGAERTTDNGYPVDTSGALDGTPLRHAADLAEVLRNDARVPDCIVDQFFRHASGRLETARDTAFLTQLKADFAANNYRFRELVLTYVTSNAFRTVAAQNTSGDKQ